MHILVIDGQGGGLGAALVTRLKARLGNAVQIWAVGTNSHATSHMLKAGDDRAATGENASSSLSPPPAAFWWPAPPAESWRNFWTMP